MLDIVYWQVSTHQPWVSAADCEECTDRFKRSVRLDTNSFIFNIVTISVVVSAMQALLLSYLISCFVNSVVFFLQRLVSASASATFGSWNTVFLSSPVSLLLRCMKCRRGLAMRILSVRLSVRLSVCLSDAWFVTKWKKDLSRFIYHTKEHLS